MSAFHIPHPLSVIITLTNDSVLRYDGASVDIEKDFVIVTKLFTQDYIRISDIKGIRTVIVGLKEE